MLQQLIEKIEDEEIKGKFTNAIEAMCKVYVKESK